MISQSKEKQEKKKKYTPQKLRQWYILNEYQT